VEDGREGHAYERGRRAAWLAWFVAATQADFSTMRAGLRTVSGQDWSAVAGELLRLLDDALAHAATETDRARLANRKSMVRQEAERRNREGAERPA
jgi:hypothetical protein